ncbi:Rha family transcriptional regulator [Shewanella algae]|uniref:Rha family transcriptional regulator n=1 Tax=Shewanella algae TaxID=38313 RepID=UPI0031F4FD08
MTALEYLPNNAVIESHGEIKTTSIKIAEAFGKRHDDVLRKIKMLDCSEDFTARNFTASEYRDRTGRKLPLWEMTKDGFMFLVMGFTGKKAATIKEAYIEAFNRLAKQLEHASGLIANYHRTQPQVYGETQEFHSQHCGLPSFFDSGWIPARFERCHVEMFWIWHARVQVKPTAAGSYYALISFGIGNEGGTVPRFTRGDGVFPLPDRELEYRHLDELWDNITLILSRFGAKLAF